MPASASSQTWSVDMDGQRSISWHLHDPSHSSQHHSCDPRTDHHSRSLTTHRHPSYRRTLVQFHRIWEVWRRRRAGRMVDRTLVREHQEEVLGEEGSSGCRSSGCIRTRRHRAVVDRPRVDTDSEGGRCWQH